MIVKLWLHYNRCFKKFCYTVVAAAAAAVGPQPQRAAAGCCCGCCRGWVADADGTVQAEGLGMGDVQFLALLLRSGIEATCLLFHRQANGGHQQLMTYLLLHFAPRADGSPIPPLFFEGPFHVRCVVGIELGEDGSERPEDCRLIVFEAYTWRDTLDIEPPESIIDSMRVSLQDLDQPRYSLVVVTGVQPDGHQETPRDLVHTPV